MSSPNTPDVTLTTIDGTTYVERPDLGITVARFHRQGNYRLRCYVSPDEFVYSEWGQRESAESVAIKHAFSF
ncbi:MAG: hypothetical protein ACR2NB_14690 [Solirubrobacteraceae bacterium]